MSAPVKVSVVVPAYNAAAFLDECLDSLEAQTIDALQVVLVDDGSTDETLAKLEERVCRRPDRFEVLTKENGGQSTARNAGLSVCTGEYVGFLDADDYADACMFERMYTEAARVDADIVTCGYRGFRDLPDGARVFDEKQQLPIGNRTVEDLYRRPQVQPCIHIVRRSILEERSIRFPEIRAFEDISFHLKVLAYAESVSCICEPFVKRRWREASTISTITRQQVESTLASIEDALEFYADVDDDRRRKLMEYASLRLLLCSTLGRANLIEQAQDRKAVVRHVISFVDENFPCRKENEFLAGALGVYLKTSNAGAVRAAGPMMARKQKKAMRL